MVDVGFSLLYTAVAAFNIIWSYLERFLINSQIIFYSFEILCICILVFQRYSKTVIDKFDNQKFGRLCLFMGIIFSMLAVLPISGKGYDVPYFVYSLKCIHKYGWGSLLTNTDRPLYYIFADILSKILPFSERVIISITGVIGAGLVALGAYLFGKKAFNSTVIGGVAALFTANMYGLTQMSISYITNLYGYAFLFIYLASLIDVFNTKTIKSMLITTFLMIVTTTLHFFSGAVAVAIFGVYCFFDVIETRKLLHLKEQALFVFHSLIYLGVMILFPRNVSSTLYLMDKANLSFSSILSQISVFFELPINNNSYESMWIVIPALLGFVIVLSSKITVSIKLIFSWVVATIILSMVIPTFRDRTIMYLPYSVLCAVAMTKIATYLTNKKIRCNIKVAVLLLLLIVPSIRFAGLAHMTIQYVNENPQPWDSVFAEQKQLIWVANNFDINKIVLVSNINWTGPFYVRDFPNLIQGAQYRILANIGNNIYGGSLEDLVKANYIGIGSLAMSPDYFRYGKDDNFQGRTVIIINSLYHFSSKDMDVLTETSMSGVYIMDELTPMETQAWLEK